MNQKTTTLMLGFLLLLTIWSGVTLMMEHMQKPATFEELIDSRLRIHGLIEKRADPNEPID
ncbi:MAG: hypothetical protein KAR40_06150 [Candidatus Sabulitectum sp.]|nr:hypothetical protein [Candidatus Sabulitectum sp.]